MSTAVEKDKSTIVAGFPAPIPPMTGEPTLREIIRVLMHIIACAQSLFTDISPLNYLFLVITEQQYARITQEPYPQIPDDPGIIPPYTNAMDANERAHAKANFEYQKARYNNCLEMSKALIERFLSLLSPKIRETYQKNVLLARPNATFLTVLQFFIDNYAFSTELDRTENRNRMLTDWHPTDGFDALVAQIQEGVLFSTYANHHIPDHDVVDMATQVAMKSGLFNDAYKEWHRRDDDEKTWEHWKDFWREELKASLDVSKAAGQYGFGNAATTTDVDAEFDNSVEKFATAHSATQAAITNLTTTNQQLAAQNQQLQLALAARQQQLMYATPAQPFQWAQQQRTNNSGNGGRRGRGGRGGRGRNTNGWTPTGGVQQQQQPPQQQNQATWPRLLTTGQPIDPRNIKACNNDNYCWTHGHNISHGHTSATCTRQHPSGLHQVAATKYNTMGGNPKGANMVRPDQCGLQEGWRKARAQQANVAWTPTAPTPAPPPTAAPTAPAQAPPYTCPPAPMMQPTMPMNLPLTPPLMMQQTANNMVGGMPQYCWPMGGNMAPGQMAYNSQQGRFM